MLVAHKAAIVKLGNMLMGLWGRKLPFFLNVLKETQNLHKVAC